MSHIKAFNPSGWSFGQPINSLVKLSSHGLVGTDRADFLKIASHDLVQFIDNIKLADGEVPMLTLALGATERWGANRNGDGWKSAMLHDWHDTFVKHARYFRNHKNRPDEGDPHYGRVVKSAFNPDMHRVELITGLFSNKTAADRHPGGLVADRELAKLASKDDIAVSMACARPGTLVLTQTGFKAVENIEIGEKVLTHRGRFRRVYYTMQRQKPGYAKLRPRYSGRQVIEMTPDHKFWIARWDDLPRGRTANALRSSEAGGICRATKTRRRHELHAYARYVPCGELNPGDFLLMPIYRGTGNSSLTVTLARLLGYYIAEGSVFRGSSSGVCFTCNKADHLVREIEALLDADTTVQFDKHSASDQAFNVHVYDAALADIVEEQVGRGVRNKVIPQTVLDAPEDIKREFLAAWFNGDGWQDVKGLHWSTCSRTLSIELQMLFASIGIPASVYRIDHTSDLPHDTPRRGDGIEYTVNISNRYSALFCERSKAKLQRMKAVKTTVFITGNFLAVPVQSVELVDGPCAVYDLSVEDDESFTVFGVAVSNCKVAYDICSSCGNKARNRTEYCLGTHEGGTCKHGGCKNNLAKVASDGHYLHVDNPNPDFFDISGVGRPADRTAYASGFDWLAKAAGDDFMPSAELAANLGITAPLTVYLEGHEEPHWNPHVHAQYKLAMALAVLEAAPKLTEAVNRSCDPMVLSSIPSTLDSLGKYGTEKAAAAVEAMADYGVVLPLGLFAKWVNKQASAKEAGMLLPGIYRRLVEAGDLQSRIESADLAGGIKQANAPAAILAQALAPDYSLAKAPATKRAMLSRLRNPNFVPSKSTFAAHEKIASADPAAATLAQQYALYKLAALYRLAGDGADFDLTVRLAIAQNQQC